MFRILDFPNQNPPLLGYRLQGEINEDELTHFMSVLEAKAYGRESINLLGEIVDIDELDDFDEVLSSFTRRLKAIRHIGKYAIVTDKALLRVAAKVENILIPVLEVRAFASEQRAQAMSWLATASEALRAAVEVVEVEGGVAIGFVIDGHLKFSDVELVNRAIENFLQEREKVNVLVEFRALTGMTPKAVWENMKQELRHVRHIGRVAIVFAEAHDWLDKVADLFTPGIDMRVFAKADTSLASRWLQDETLHLA